MVKRVAGGTLIMGSLASNKAENHLMGVSATKIKTERDPKQKNIPIQQNPRRQQQLTSMSARINQGGSIEGMASDATFSLTL